MNPLDVNMLANPREFFLHGSLEKRLHFLELASNIGAKQLGEGVNMYHGISVDISSSLYWSRALFIYFIC